jgi:UDP-2,4-diacetamido-2,4,6-trideoxy-beta-L-altropyranose hydrolase
MNGDESRKFVNILVRADGNAAIGFGHVMRCLALYDAVAALRGAEIVFCSAAAFPVPETLTAPRAFRFVGVGTPLLDRAFDPGWEAAPAARETQRADAAAVRDVLPGFEPDLVIVDHYLLDGEWERAWPDSRILAVDDLANREHACALLLDQTFGRKPADYAGLVPPDCRLLLGSKFALLRCEFAELRPQALARRGETTRIETILVNFGASDVGGLTVPVLAALRETDFAGRIAVVCGGQAPALPGIAALADADPRIALRVDVADMARTMAEADLAIGAGGATSWERCALALPSVALETAQNQRAIQAALARHGAIVAANDAGDAARQAIALAGNLQRWRAMAFAASEVCDGLGAPRVAEALLSPAVSQHRKIR